MCEKGLNMKKRFLPLGMALLLVLSFGNFSAFAENSINSISSTEETSVVDELRGIGNVVTMRDAEGRITDRSTYYPATGEIVQEVFDLEPETVVEKIFIASEHYCVIQTEQLPNDTCSNTSNIIESTKHGNSVAFPQATDYGLAISTVFDGYKFIGQIFDFGVTAKLHRHIDSHEEVGSGFSFNFTEDMSEATIYALITALVTGNVNFIGITGAIIGGMARGFFNALQNGLNRGKLQVDRLHYTYKVTMNSSSTATASYCDYFDYYVSSLIDSSGTVHERIYETKGPASPHGPISGHSIDKVRSAIQTYLDGETPWDTVCGLGS